MSKFFIRITNHTTKEVYEWKWVQAKTPALALSYVWRKIADYIQPADEIEIEIHSVSRAE